MEIMYNRYNLPFDLEFEFWGYEVSSPPLGPTVQTKDGVLVLAKEQAFEMKQKTGQIREIKKISWNDSILMAEVIDQNDSTVFIKVVQSNSSSSKLQIAPVANFKNLPTGLTWVKFDDLYPYKYYSLD